MLAHLCLPPCRNVQCLPVRGWSPRRSVQHIATERRGSPPRSPMMSSSTSSSCARLSAALPSRSPRSTCAHTSPTKTTSRIACPCLQLCGHSQAPCSWQAPCYGSDKCDCGVSIASHFSSRSAHGLDVHSAVVQPSVMPPTPHWTPRCTRASRHTARATTTCCSCTVRPPVAPHCSARQQRTVSFHLDAQAKASVPQLSLQSAASYLWQIFARTRQH